MTTISCLSKYKVPKEDITTFPLNHHGLDQSMDKHRSMQETLFNESNKVNTEKYKTLFT